jgi:hypothetical protein
VLLCTITVTGQSKLIKVVNDSTAEIPISELKYITAKFIELNAARKTNDLLIKDNGILKRVISDKQNIIDIHNEIIETLKQQIEDIRPSWWNKFSWGFGTASVVFLILMLLVK